jgi:hypothetical protein
MLIVLAAAMAAATGATAQVTIDLPGLQGEYSIGGSDPEPPPSARAMTFTFPDSVASLDGLRLQVLRSLTSGQYIACRDVGGMVYCDTLPMSGYLFLRLTAEPLGECSFEVVYDWPYDTDLRPVCPAGTVDFDLLLGTEVTAELIFSSGSIPVANIIEASGMVLTTVQLVTSGAVPAAASTWGDLKARYRDGRPPR